MSQPGQFPAPDGGFPGQPPAPGYQAAPGPYQAAPGYPGYQGAPGYEPYPGYHTAPGGYPPGQAYNAAPTYGRGPIGVPRGIGISVLLAIVTFGIYTYVWTWKTHDEVKRHSGDGVGGGLGFVIYFLAAPVTYFLLPSEINKMLTSAGRPCAFTWQVGFWILLPLIGPIIWFVTVQSQLNEYWQSLGARPV